MGNKNQLYSKQEENLKYLMGAKIKKLRENRNWSQHQLSVEALLPKNQIGRIERGEIYTTLLSLFRISIALNVKLKDLIPDDELLKK